MKNSPTDKAEVEIPLKAADSPPEEPPEAETRGGCCSSLCFCFRTFIQSTTIRGAKHCLSNNIILRLFWICFIILSFALVITVSSYCIIAYTSFQTVVRQHKRIVYGRDFPVVTVCSDGLFGDTDEIRGFANHPKAYDFLVTKALEASLKEGNYKKLRSLESLRSMTSYNANNMAVMQRLLKDIVKRRLVKEFNIYQLAAADIECKIGDNLCKKEVFINLDYRNCLSFRVPDGLKNAVIDNFFISGFLLSGKNPSILPPTTVTNGILPTGRHIHVFLHEEGTLPGKQPDFVIYMNSDKWILIDFDVTHLTRTITPRFSCALDPVPNTTHAGFPIRLNPKVCQKIGLRNQVSRKCKCQSPTFPYNVWPLDGRHFCGSIGNNLSKALMEMKCFRNFLYLKEDTNLKCEIPCSERMYQSRISVNNFERSSLNRITRELKLATYVQLANSRCRGRRGKRKNCVLIKQILTLLVENSTVDFNNYRKMIKYGTTKSYWDEAYPNNASDEIKNANTKFEKPTFAITLRCPKAQANAEDEYLVRTIWTTLAQVGGASSFLAGFTFGVIAEVIETLYKFCRGPKNV